MAHYAYQVLCRIEFTDGHAKPRWYTIGQYDQKAAATGRARRFCRYLGEMRAQEPPRNKPHSLVAYFEIRGPEGSWRECQSVVPKGVSIFAMMHNEKGVQTGTRAAPKRKATPAKRPAAKPKALPAPGLLVVQLEERSPGWKGVKVISQHRDKKVAMRRAADVLDRTLETIKPEKGRQLRATVRSDTGKLLVRTEWVAA